MKFQVTKEDLEGQLLKCTSQYNFFSYSLISIIHISIPSCTIMVDNHSKLYYIIHTVLLSKQGAE